MSHALCGVCLEKRLIAVGGCCTWGVLRQPVVSLPGWGSRAGRCGHTPAIGCVWSRVEADGCRGATPQAQANDATASSVDSVEALTHDAMPLLDAAVVKSWCSGTQTVAKARDDAAAVNTVHVCAPAPYAWFTLTTAPAAPRSVGPMHTSRALVACTND
jgi:hypothetical protein